jgi:hypothetical protein
VACLPDRIPLKHFDIGSIVTTRSSLLSISTGHDDLDETQTERKGHHPTVFDEARQNHSANFQVNENCHLARLPIDNKTHFVNLSLARPWPVLVVEASMVSHQSHLKKHPPVVHLRKPRSLRQGFCTVLVGRTPEAARERGR